MYYLLLVSWSLDSRFPFWSRNLLGLNFHGSFQILGSWCVAHRFNNTWNRTNHPWWTILAIDFITATKKNVIRKHFLKKSVPVGSKRNLRVFNCLLDQSHLGPLVTPVLEIVLPHPWVLKPVWFSQVHSCLHGDPKGHTRYYNLNRHTKTHTMKTSPTCTLVEVTNE